MADADRSERWAELYDSAFPRVYRALVGTLLDRDAALDALHDAFEEGLRRPPAHDANLAGWLYRVALRKGRRALLRRRADVPLTEDVPADGKIAMTLDQLEAGRLLAMLSERQRSVIVAHYFLGLTQLEVGELLGLRRGTVGATISQSLARMRRGAV
ncbi:MAG: RNA polymerase sigma factor [Candidatus Limnocylindria bacterium]